MPLPGPLRTLMILAIGLGGGSALTWAYASDLLASRVLTAQAAPAAAPHRPTSVSPGLVGTNVVADLVERVDGAVVSIDTVARSERDPVLDLFFGNEVPPEAYEQKGVGSGFIIDSGGLIVTNNHVVQGATEIRVTTATGQIYRGRVIGADPSNDLALVRVNGKGLPALKFASQEHIRVGDWVLAVGSPLGLSHTVSVGIVSALNRGLAISDRVNFVQTDAAINPGNSGGPLINLQGEVVGVNTAIAAQGQGIGFAIPAWTAQNVVTQLRTKGRVERTWLGVSIRDVSQDDVRGVLIVGTAPNGPARQGGLRAGDVVIEVDGHPVHTTRDLLSFMNDRTSGTVVRMTILRGDRRENLNITLQAAPSQPLRR